MLFLQGKGGEKVQGTPKNFTAKAQRREEVGFLQLRILF